MTTMRRHDHPAGRTIFESSDSTDDIERGRFLPSLHSPISPSPPSPRTRKSVTFGTPPTFRKKNYVRRKRRLADMLSPEHVVPPSLASHPTTHQPPNRKSEPSGGHILPHDRPPSRKPNNLDLQATTEYTDTSKGGTKSDDSMEPPITPGGSLSPAVDKLIKSLQFRTHKRTGSGGSITGLQRTQERGSNTAISGSITDEKGIRNPCSPLHGLVRVGSSSNQMRHTGTSLETQKGGGCKLMPNGIPYSTLDSSDSDSDPETIRQQDGNFSTTVLTSDVLRTHQERETLLASRNLALEGQHSTATSHQLPLNLLSAPKHQGAGYVATLSNESSCEVTGTDGHDADSESDCGESTTEHFLATDSLTLSLTPTFSTSPLPLSSTTTISDHTNPSPLSSLASLGSPVPPDNPPSPTDTLTTTTPRELTPAAPPDTEDDGEEEERYSAAAKLPDNAVGRTGRATTSDHDNESNLTSHQGQVAILISQFEVESGVGGRAVEDREEGDSDVAKGQNGIAGAPCDNKPRLEVPLHIRRNHHQTSGAYSPAGVEPDITPLHDSALGNSTSIVRHFFENIVSKGLPEEVGMHRTYNTTELEDSGFQVSNTVTTVPWDFSI